MLSTRHQFAKTCKAYTFFKRTVKTATARVRFAPSPTGYLHLGGLRTALYNHLFAKSRNGVFILRIEDTDQTRKVEGSVAALLDDLNWAGIECHEGPNNGGSFGPYVQSERLHIYQEYIQKLLDNGSAYKCFCTDRRLNILRRDAIKRHQIPKYDNKCRSLSINEATAKTKSGTPYCIRFKAAILMNDLGPLYRVYCESTSTETVTFIKLLYGQIYDIEAFLIETLKSKLSSDCQSFDDMIFGGIAYDVSLNEGDPVLMKSDGYPTYHFANVVDDHLMKISHVLRGVEWQISTTKHLLIYRAFGWTPPQFGHLPLIVNSDGTKLSKRQSDVKVEDYRNKGVYPLALVNYISMAGGGFDHVPGAGVRLKTIHELATEFQIEKINSHPSRLNPDLLEECNRLEIKRQLQGADTSKELVVQLQKLILEKYPNENLNISDNHIKNILNWATSRISRIDELVSSKFAFLWILPSQNNLETKKDVLEQLLKDLERIDQFEQNSIKENLKRFSSDNGIKFPALMKMLRSALSGLNEGPSVAEMMQLLGKSQSLERIKAVIK